MEHDQPREERAGERRALEEILDQHPDTTRKLRALWALHAVGGFTEKLGLRLLTTGDEFLRAWAIQFLAEGKKPSDAVLKEFVRLAGADPSPVVRLYLAAAAQRITISQRENILLELISHAED